MVPFREKKITFAVKPLVQIHCSRWTVYSSGYVIQEHTCDVLDIIFVIVSVFLFVEPIHYMNRGDLLEWNHSQIALAYTA